MASDPFLYISTRHICIKSSIKGNPYARPRLIVHQEQFIISVTERGKMLNMSGKYSNEVGGGGGGRGKVSRSGQTDN